MVAQIVVTAATPATYSPFVIALTLYREVQSSKGASKGMENSSAT